MAVSTEGFLKSYKFQFDIFVEKIELTVSFNCQVSVIWKRSNNKIETKTKPTLDVNSNQAVFNEKLTMCSNMYFNEKVKTFHEKKVKRHFFFHLFKNPLIFFFKTSFTVVLATSKGNKVAGSYTMDLGALINNKVVELTESYKLDKCPDKNARIFLTIKTSFLGEVKDVDAVRSYYFFFSIFMIDLVNSRMFPD
jgi:hypothetical protein